MRPQLFIYTITKASRPRATGGLNYTVSVYEITPEGAEHIGERKCNTAAHKGEISEAWAVVLESGKLRKSILSKIKKCEKSVSYYVWQFPERYNVKLQQVG